MGDTLSSRVERILQGESMKPRSRVEVLLQELIDAIGGGDVFLNGGELLHVETADVPYPGAEVGDPYLELTLNNEAQTRIDIPLKELEDQPKCVTVTLLADGWVNGRQTVAVEGVLADESRQLIQPVPAAASYEAYKNAGVEAVSQGNNSLIFSCETLPSDNLNVFVCITEVRV